ncbi:thioesterase II family protein [Actinokineospora xionganensis]|uniref:Thioesterase n=1 Tax=Actinokineospora xionganensis TaxID=2684470 RepID=A0ABR7L912_9PSEU|nr:alpha/beta fold hydrolase [Actinokineospora xionganensis]MBC6449043.1 thioesterase [Actinokineospora xionganensis]
MNNTAVDTAWIREFHAGPGVGPTVVCFPHAGGSASYFRPLSAALERRHKVLALQYPGRQDRRGEPFLSSIADFADEAYRALEPILDGPVAFFGHSMGATIAFEVGLRMKRRRAASPVALFASGRRAPSIHREGTVHLRDDAGLVEELNALNGTDIRILGDKDVLDMILPPMRNDYRAVETYRYEPGPKLDCPVTALIGDVDPHVDLDEAMAWGEHTTGPFSLRMFTGGHFYLSEHNDAIADVVGQTLQA